MSNLDCGDNSCMFALKGGGMRTNGGCRCFENAGYGRSATGAAYKLLPEVINLKELVQGLQEQVVQLTKEWNKIGTQQSSS